MKHEGGESVGAIIRKAKRFLNRAEQGQATLEAVLALPCVLLVVLVALEGAYMFTTYLDCQNAAKAAFLAIEPHHELRIADDREELTDIATEAVLRDTGWDDARVDVELTPIGTGDTVSYRHQILMTDGTWATAPDGNEGRPSHYSSQDVGIVVTYETPAATPVGFIAAALTGHDQSFGVSYPVSGAVVGALDETSQGSW